MQDVARANVLNRPYVDTRKCMLMLMDLVTAYPPT